MTSETEQTGERIDATDRIDARDQPWASRPWAMAALCALSGLGFWAITEHIVEEPLSSWRPAAASGLAVATIIFTFAVELRRWHWAAAFAVLWGVVTAFVVWNTGGYNVGGSFAEWPFFSVLLAATVAAPLFQTKRDVADSWTFWRLWQLPYRQLHLHAWTDAVLGAAAMLFVGITFALAWMISSLFMLIDIDFVRELLQKDWFGWMLAGAAFGGAIGLLRERDKLVGTMQRLVMIILSVLAPVLAVALVLFLVSSIGTGFAKLWESGFSATALMLAVAAAAVLFANAVIGNGDEDRSPNRVLHWSAAILAVTVLPLAIIAAVAMQLRIADYGWTPERIWGVIAVVIALGYGLSGLWSLVRGRAGFDAVLRPLQQKLAITLGALALFLALPIVDFGAISAQNQLARLRSGAIAADKFDWQAMAFDFGPAGRRALRDLARTGSAGQRTSATAALAQTERHWEYETVDPDVDHRPLAVRLRVIPADRPLPPAAMTALGSQYQCAQGACVAAWIDERRIAFAGQSRANEGVISAILYHNSNGDWATYDENNRPDRHMSSADLSTATVELRSVTAHRLFVDGKPQGELVE
ncbi:MAG: DUF4153 domain-containing protein [Pseudomonadota bacterium]